MSVLFVSIKTFVKTTALFIILFLAVFVLIYIRIYCFFCCYGRFLFLTNMAYFQAGNIVTWRLALNLPHISIVSDKKTQIVPLCFIHNIGKSTQEEVKYYIFGIIVTGFITRSY
ncbi:DUF1287 domain-containing protein [Aggregatibacter actinomycetemcomitans]|uniref:DUF1287 domain-containing protein n=2 Tax=Aggregatibacter actinomycetemcomitans TaxID=714 RepID=UPI00197CB12D|nr:DUF1287 domain-containing protein [Aggregatibacter actinomycetemcomitans]MBN6068305.1 DUF1287 domain-containing protein [Aggregatibacter actinomycetemcomitans]MBN6086329.1 DUF1287 domain-containing protein [Aggregatibacter actinomycetemcomitans]